MIWEASMSSKAFIAIGIAAFAFASGAFAKDVLNGPVETRIGRIELQGGYPSDSSVKKLYDEIDFQRASQAYIWATPIVAMEALRRANKRDWGVDYNDVGLVDGYTTPAVSALTANNTTIYAGVFTDLERDGPMVIDSPMGVYGVIDDFWQRPVVEVGPFGPDKGKGGKFLLLPPGIHGHHPGWLSGGAVEDEPDDVRRPCLREGRRHQVGGEHAGRHQGLSAVQGGKPAETRVVRVGEPSAGFDPPRGFRILAASCRCPRQGTRRGA